ncbi:hypothetical protein ONA91_13465 [Micromonospora sp. DR5-3]|uniref:hypothetical protein n=1 Tax=unclassified Micromonospora TaxID=2617518 RepID=UPI0011DB38ED|nr:MULTISPECIES: hypothetical protein [unclassified Micromonospora]MCW3815463.1 hypothetical protein [Micromonospora sp. DR5-3]TYC24275.1 hypothetical protein FXF52_11000 [Micromonospora sp. MP36]
MSRVPLRRAGVVVTAALAALLALAAPAAAHGADAPAGTDYRAEVTSLSPARPGLTARMVEAGARLELTNRTGPEVEVLGYSGEPYLRVGPGGVYENTRSPATYLNRTITGDTQLPPQADPAAAPSWRRVSDGPSARWHDQRTLWLESDLPPQVTADPTREQRVRDWVVPVRAGGEPIEVRGTLDWVPPPDPYPWWAAATLGFLLVGAAGLVPGGSAAGGRALRGVGALLALGGLATVALSVGRALDAGAEGVGGVLLGLVGGQTWPLLTGLGALAAGGYALARREAADFTLALAGACLALFAGVANLAVLSRSVVPVLWPASLARVLVTLILATGAGAVAAGLLRLHAASRAARQAPRHPRPTAAAAPARH